MSQLDLQAIRAKLAASSGRQYWKSLDELAGTEAFLELLQREFPREAAPMFEAGVDRRQFLKLMGASLALAGLSACTSQPDENIVPYVKPPEDIVPGEPLYFATAIVLGGYATGVLVESHVGRPTKIEGNPQHPASLGATDALTQASILTLYDPDRSQVVRHIDEIVPWAQFDAALATRIEALAATGGAGLRILTGTVTSPTLAAQLRDVLAKYPRARWHQYEPLGRDGALRGASAAFGAAIDAQYAFDKARVIVSLDADFLGGGPGVVRHVRDFASRRRPREGAAEMSRLYVVESALSITGAKADHRLALRPSEIEGFARAVAARLGVQVDAPPAAERALWIEAVAGDLQQHRGASLVVAGAEQGAGVHALAHAMNVALGNVGHTVTFVDPVAAQPVDQAESLRALVGEMQSGAVELLMILGGNPVYDAPADQGFAQALAKVGLRIHLGLYDDETSELCHWHLPAADDLESWSDARAMDGTTTILQPLIAPLYGGRTAHEILAALQGGPARSGYEIVREAWRAIFQEKTQAGAPAFDRFWKRCLNDGVVAGSASPVRKVALRADWNVALGSPAAAAPAPAPAAARRETFEVAFRADPSLYDGRFANNGWLQELPRPLSKLTWGNAVLVAPGDAERLGLENGAVVELEVGGRRARGPVWIAPGQAPGCVTVNLGNGRRRAGRVGDGVGFDAYALRTLDAPWAAPGAVLRKTGDFERLACVQDHHSLEGRPIVRSATLDEYRAHPEFAREMVEDPAPDDSLYPNYAYEGNAWGMAIDLNACVGCNACTAACQAENNIPVVGKEQVLVGREMHWIRIDRYWSDDLELPTTDFQPMLCQHCERAPCEVVCPVNATVHDSEGLNLMVYNRCVGTRYCSNNCPYKVRRFNFFLFQDWTTESLKLQRNPEVTVRSRGVMEKCTYCVQRISHARIAARREGREVRDGEVTTACQQVCPAEAIVFGNVNDKGSRVAQQKADPRNYAVLGELNVRPRTTYLAPVRNPNPQLAKREGEKS